MAWVAVASYYVRFNTKEHQPVIGIYYREGGNADGRLVAQHFPMKAQDALFVADMLRHEGPIFIDPDSGALASGKEVVGESEPEAPASES